MSRRRQIAAWTSETGRWSVSLHIPTGRATLHSEGTPLLEFPSVYHLIVSEAGGSDGAELVRHRK